MRTGDAIASDRLSTVLIFVRGKIASNVISCSVLSHIYIFICLTVEFRVNCAEDVKRWISDLLALVGSTAYVHDVMPPTHTQPDTLGQQLHKKEYDMGHHVSHG